MQNPQRRDSTSYADNASRRLWDRFAEMFGARFYDQYGSDPSEAWTEAVVELRGDQVKSALTKIRNSGAQYPPSLPEFLALARSQRPPQKFDHSSDLDKFDRFGNIQFRKFLHLYDTTPAQLPELLRRKREVIDAAREDPDMHIPDGLDDEFRGTMERQHGELLHGILFTAWRQVIGATELPTRRADGFVRVGAA